MTSPLPSKDKKTNPGGGADPAWIKWVYVGTLSGGIIASLVILHIGKKDLALGIGFGSGFFTLNFYSLKILAEKSLRAGLLEGKKVFWIWNAARWAVLAVVCWGFLSVSTLCLAGAAASYFWFLLVLSSCSWRFAKFPPTGKDPSDIY